MSASQPNSDSSSVDRSASDPATSDPATSDPATSDPATSDPATSDPAIDTSQDVIAATEDSTDAAEASAPEAAELDVAEAPEPTHDVAEAAELDATEAPAPTHDVAESSATESTTEKPPAVEPASEPTSDEQPSEQPVIDGTPSTEHGSTSEAAQTASPSIGQSAPAGTVPPASPAIGQSAPAGTIPTGHLAAPGANRGPSAKDDPLHQASGGVDVGRVIEVTVDSIGPKEVMVRLADGREGVISRPEFSDSVSGGDKIRAALLARQDPRNRVWLSYSWAKKLDGWSDVEEALANKSPVSGTVSKAVKGGFVLDLGIRAFLPSSQVPEGSAAELIGKTVQALVIEADREKDRLVVSIRDHERRESRVREKELFKSLDVGKLIDGTIESVADYGAIVDLGGVRGLVPRREISWGRFDDVGDVVSPGDPVRVQVLDVNRSKRRITLSLRQTSPDPLATVKEGDIVTATVTKVVEYGAFMQIEDSELEGLAHVSELTEARSYDARELVIPGEEFQVRILEIEPRKRRVALSVKAAI